ncbi:MAG: J domain-containing protein [Acidobacteriota bacterium]
MSLGRRLYHVFRSRLGEVRNGDIFPEGAFDPERLRRGARSGWKAAERTFRETRDAYRRGRWGSSEGGPGGRGAGGPGTGGSATGGSSGGGTAGAGARDPEMAAWYANLEVPYGSDLETVTRAWKRLVRDYHPDRHAQDPGRQEDATELLKGLNHAYDQLRRRLEKQA